MSLVTRYSGPLGAFQDLSGPLGHSLGGLEDLLSSLGGLLEPSWGALWTLLGTFWGAWRAQEDLLGPLGRHLEASWDTPRKSYEKNTILDLKNHGVGHTFGGPKINKNRQKSVEFLALVLNTIFNDFSLIFDVIFDRNFLICLL